jgi:hypothetical protein
VLTEAPDIRAAIGEKILPDPRKVVARIRLCGGRITG